MDPARLRLPLLVAIALLAAVVAGLVAHVGLVKRVELNSIDARFSVRGGQPAPKDVVFVAIDEKSDLDEQTHGKADGYPFNRRHHAAVIRRLVKDGARAIAYDVEFTSPTNEVDDEALFEGVAAAHGRIALATIEQVPPSKSLVLGGVENVRDAKATVASGEIPLDRDGTIRQYDARVNAFPSLATAAVRLAGERPVIPHRFGIDFAGGPGAIRRYSFIDVEQGRIPPSAFRGKIVVVGATIRILGDLHDTAAGADMPGAEIHANAISTILRGFPLNSAATWTAWALVLLMAAAPALGGLSGSVPRTLLAAAAALILLLVVAQLSFNSGRIVRVAEPGVALLLSTFGVLAANVTLERLRRRRTRAAFGRFAPAEVVDAAVAAGGGDLRDDGVELDATVLFCDLRGFTSASEKLPADRVIAIVNRYQGEVGSAVQAHGGTIVTAMGDGLMAVFGAPTARPDHADIALAAAAEIAGPRIAAFNAWLEAEHLAAPFRVGVGLCSGTVMSGNVGSEERVGFTVIGDTTNTASRIEGLTKQTGDRVLVADSTRERLTREPPPLLDRGEHEIRGRAEPVRLWALPD